MRYHLCQDSFWKVVKTAKTSDSKDKCSVCFWHHCTFCTFVGPGKLSHWYVDIVGYLQINGFQVICKNNFGGKFKSMDFVNWVTCTKSFSTKVYFTYRKLKIWISPSNLTHSSANERHCLLFHFNDATLKWKSKQCFSLADGWVKLEGLIQIFSLR